MSEPTMWAFWRCDNYPYILSGLVVGGPNTLGFVQIKRYETEQPDGTYGGHWNRPLLLLPAERGQKIARQLDTLRKTHDLDKRDFATKWNAKLNILPTELRTPLTERNHE